MSTTNGTFVAVKLRDDSVRVLYDYAVRHNIPNLLDPNEYHCTILNSTSRITEQLGQYDLSPSWVAIPSSFAVFTANFGGKTTKCCVLTLVLPEASDLRKDLHATNDLGEPFYIYEPHITLSYDIGDFDVKSLPSLEGISELHLSTVYIEERKPYATWKNNRINRSKNYTKKTGQLEGQGWCI